MTADLWRCTVCGRVGTVGRCCGEETRERANVESLIAENERMAEALREMIELREATQRGEVHPTRHELDIVKDARALLREQEEGSGFWPEMPKNGGPDWTGFDG